VPSPDKEARRQAALWIGEHAEARCIAAYRLRAAYYAGAERFVQIPAIENAQLLVDSVRDAGADFLLLDDTRLGETEPELLQGATPLHRVPYSGGAVLVFALDPAMPPVGSR